MTINDTPPILELKIKAKIALKSYRRPKNSFHSWTQHLPDFDNWQKTPPKLQEIQEFVAKKAGFNHWRHAAAYLGGDWEEGEDAGRFWYNHQCGTLLNVWCRDYAEALEHQKNHLNTLIFPYKTQFVLAEKNYLSAIGLNSAVEHLQRGELEPGAPLYSGKNWTQIALARINAIFNSGSIQAPQT